MASGAPGEPIASWNKDPDVTRVYGVDWSDWLSEISDSISASSWTAASTNASGISTTGATYATGGTTRQTFAGGTPGETYLFMNKITTAGGETEERTIEINVIER